MVVKTKNGTQAPATHCSPKAKLTIGGRYVDIRCDVTNLSSDGGAVLLRRLDDAMALTAGYSELLDDARDADRVLHSRLEQMRQRTYQIALGYEDCNDGDWLRHDPALRVAFGSPDPD